MMRVIFLTILMTSATLSAREAPTTRPRMIEFSATQPALAGNDDYVLHLPGIGGLMRIDFLLTTGLRDGGIGAQIDVYDWTSGNPGLPALGNLAGNRAQAKKVAAMIEARRHAHPHATLTITGHSAGAGIAVWALESLPDDVQIDTLVMLAPALSPDYDLSPALRHVKRAYAFTSIHDPILGAGTRAFGTVDRINTDAAGRVGFVMPAGADAGQYAKLRQFPYDKSWMRYGNIGDHIGPMMRRFARSIIAPLLLTGEIPASTTQPATTGAAR